MKKKVAAMVVVEVVEPVDQEVAEPSRRLKRYREGPNAVKSREELQKMKIAELHST